jgi:hypothetical protein
MTSSRKRPEKLLSKIISELYYREKLMNGDTDSILNKEALLTDRIIDVPSILSSRLKQLIYGEFNQLSLRCGTGELSLHYYSEIKCSKHDQIYEDGIGISTIYILLAMVENERQKQHYLLNKVRHPILNDCFYRRIKNWQPTFYIDCRNTDQEYLKKVQYLINSINEDGLVKVSYVDSKAYDNEEYMSGVFSRCTFINLDKGESSKKYWEKILTYYSANKVVCWHNLGAFYPWIDTKSIDHAVDSKEYSIVVYPIVEENKNFQNGCLKIAFVDKSQTLVNQALGGE